MANALAYWGGKEKLAPRIADLIDNAGEHTIYCEPFAGGASVFFARRYLPPVEVLNDKGGAITAFWRQVQDSPSAIADRLETTIFAQEVFTQMKELVDNPEGHDPADVAFAMFYCSNTAISSNIQRGQISCANFAVSELSGIPNAESKAKRNNYTKRENMQRKVCFLRDAQARLQRTVITQKDAVQIINSLDSEVSVFYIDPPYLGQTRGSKQKADQGHYAGWTEDDHDRLIAALKSLKGKFVLSEYAHPKILALAEERGWQVESVDMSLSASSVLNGRKVKRNPNAGRKQEFIIRNFTPRYMESLRRKVIIAGGKKICLPPEKQK